MYFQEVLYIEHFRKKLALPQQNRFSNCWTGEKKEKGYFILFSHQLLCVSWERTGRRGPDQGREAGQGRPTLFPFSLLTFPMTLGKSLTLLASPAPSIKREVLVGC